MERVRAELAKELTGSWSLFASDILREAYATAAPTRVVFVLEVPDVEHARQHLEGLPLVAAGLMQLELIELRPFVNWSMLFAK
jgi:hypothetical protein